MKFGHMLKISYAEFGGHESRTRKGSSSTTRSVEPIPSPADVT